MSKLAAFLRRGAPAAWRRCCFWEPFPRRRRRPAPRYTRRSCPSAATPTAGGGIRSPAPIRTRWKRWSPAWTWASAILKSPTICLPPRTAICTSRPAATPRPTTGWSSWTKTCRWSAASAATSTRTARRWPLKSLLAFSSRRKTISMWRTAPPSRSSPGRGRQAQENHRRPVERRQRHHRRRFRGTLPAVQAGGGFLRADPCGGYQRQRGHRGV